MAVLLPALSKAREQGKRAVCRSYLHNFVVLCSAYAHDYDAKLPSFSAPNGPLIHDWSEDMVYFLEKDYSLEHKELYCPSIPKWRVEQSLGRDRIDGGAIVVGYNYWVQRYVEHYSGPIPPNVNYSKFTVLDKPDYIGPTKIYDRRGKTSPVITDQIYTKMAHPVDGNIGKDKSYDISIFCTHKWNECIDVCNQAYIDGHVECVQGDLLKARYGYGSGPDGTLVWR
jgi:hypothetical protein